MSKKQLKSIPAAIVDTTIPQALSPVQAAMQSGASPTELLEFMKLQERFDNNQAKKAFVLAMSKFRADCPTMEKTEKGHNHKYASISGMLVQIKSLLAENGLSHSWRMSQANDLITVTCIVTHSQGHSEETSITAPPDNGGSIKGIKGIGSTITYLERYTLTALLGLASGERDDDGDASISPRISDDQAVGLHAMLIDGGLTLDGAMRVEAYVGKKLKCSGFEGVAEVAYDDALYICNESIKRKQLASEL